MSSTIGSASIKATNPPCAVISSAPAQFECVSKPGTGDIVERLWDFNHGIAEVMANPRHTFERPGKYRVTLVVWDSAGSGGRIEKTIEVATGK
ncbi:MAG: PKD domain-containing protein [Sedimentisphaerales bacterium]|nr:PKD domain-containing protein [Sedimentisphaerales bacterium]